LADSTFGQGATFKVYWPAQRAETDHSGDDTLTEQQRATICQGPQCERETLRG
jgi:hypothetical protein